MPPTRRQLLAAAGASIVLAGCIGTDDDDADEPTPTPDETPTPTPEDTPTPDGTPGPPATVGVADHPELGEILVDGDGWVIYMFDNDTQDAGESTCYDECATSWPPLVIENDPTAGDAVTAELTTFERDDGELQVAADGWPLYYFAGDGESGDANGQGVEDVWWVLRPDGSVVRDDDTEDTDDDDETDDGNGGGPGY